MGDLFARLKACKDKRKLIGSYVYDMAFSIENMLEKLSEAHPQIREDMHYRDSILAAKRIRDYLEEIQ
jgi:hypothetical protein